MGRRYALGTCGTGRQPGAITPPGFRRRARFWRSLKDECCRRIVVPLGLVEMQSELDVYTAWYNQHRPHRALGGATPAKRRAESDHAWRVAATDVLKYDESGSLVSCNLDLKNPKRAEALEHLPPEQLVEDILAKERRIIELMEEIKAELTRADG